MEYLNMGTLVVGVLLIFSFFNADALFREAGISDPALMDPFEEDSVMLEPGVMISRKALTSLAEKFGFPTAELERRLANGDSLREIAADSKREAALKELLDEYTPTPVQQ